MNSFFWTLRLFLFEDDGPTSVEYAVMLSLIVCVCMAVITLLGSNVAGVFSHVANQL